MAYSNLDLEGDVDLVRAWPNQRAAAEMLGISESALSRNTDFEFEPVGGQARHYRPRIVLEAGASYKRRSLNAIAAGLLAHASEHGRSEHFEPVKAEIDGFFAHRSTVPIDRERFLRDASRALPRRLFHEVQRAFDQGVIEEPELESADFEYAGTQSKLAGGPQA